MQSGQGNLRFKVYESFDSGIPIPSLWIPLLPKQGRELSTANLLGLRIQLSWSTTTLCNSMLSLILTFFYSLANGLFICCQGSPLSPILFLNCWLITIPFPLTCSSTPIACKGCSNPWSLKLLLPLNSKAWEIADASVFLPTGSHLLCTRCLCFPTNICFSTLVPRVTALRAIRRYWDWMERMGAEAPWWG